MVSIKFGSSGNKWLPVFFLITDIDNNVHAGIKINDKKLEKGIVNKQLEKGIVNKHYYHAVMIVT